MKIRSIIFWAALALALWLPSPAAAQAQSEALTLRMSRDFGYGGFDNQIEGLFSLRAEGPQTLTRVEFYINNQLMATVNEPPFRYQFNTNQYPAGEHVFSARGFTTSGEQLQSNQLTRVLLSAEESRQMLVRTVGPILGITLLISLLIGALSLRVSSKPFDGSYGLLGGAVCPQCQLPYALHWLAPRLITRRLQRCPHCGKWAWVGRAKPADLATAEARWRGQDQQAARGDEAAERSRRQIDDSRFDS